MPKLVTLFLFILFGVGCNGPTEFGRDRNSPACRGTEYYLTHAGDEHGSPEYVEVYDWWKKNCNNDGSEIPALEDSTGTGDPK